MGINAWNAFVLRVEHLYICIVRKSLDMGEPTFHAENTACYQLQKQTKVHVLSLVRQTSKTAQKHSIIMRAAAQEIRRFH